MWLTLTSTASLASTAPPLLVPPRHLALTPKPTSSAFRALPSHARTHTPSGGGGLGRAPRAAGPGRLTRPHPSVCGRVTFPRLPARGVGVQVRGGRPFRRGGAGRGRLLWRPSGVQRGGLGRCPQRLGDVCCQLQRWPDVPGRRGRHPVLDRRRVRVRQKTERVPPKHPPHPRHGGSRGALRAGRGPVRLLRRRRARLSVSTVHHRSCSMPTYYPW